MKYQTEDPETYEVSHAIPLVEQCPQLRSAFEALRHEHQPPDVPEFDTDSEPPLSTRSKATFSSDESQSLTKKQQLAPFQHTLVPPTDAECGLPSAFSAALSEIPASAVPLSRVLAAPEKAAVINGHTRLELSEALAHAANLRRATGNARAILVIASSERAVMEWITGMCQVLDEVQIISYSRAKAKREATLLRLRQSQYPGIVVAAEKTLKDGIRELWEALRQNRIAKKWEIVISEMVTDKNIEGECSPLRMIRDCMAEKGVLVAKKGLTQARACKFVRNLRGVDVDKRFWLSKTGIRKIAVEESRKETEGSKGSLEDGNKRLAGKSPVKSNGQKSKGRFPEGKENRLLPTNATQESSRKSGETSNSIQPAQAKGKRRRRTSDAAKRETRSSKELSPEADRVVNAVPSPSGTRKISGGVVKSRKGKEPSRHAKTTNNTGNSGSVVMSAEFEELLSKKGGTRRPRKSSESPVKPAIHGRNLRDRVRRALLSDAAAETRTKTTPKNGMSLDGPIKPPGPRRRSPRLFPALSSNEQSIDSAAGKGQSKQRSGEIRKEEDGPVASLSTASKKKASAPLGSSNLSSVIRNVCISNSEEDDKTSSQKTREKVKSRARALRLYSSESEGSGEDKFYTPPSHAPTPQSKDTTPEKFFSPRTSFSPKKNTNSDQCGPRSLPPSQPNKGPIIKQTIPKPHKSSTEKRFASGSPSSPLNMADQMRKKKRPDLIEDSSDDQPLAEKMRILKEKRRRHVVATALKPDGSCDDQPLAGMLSDRRKKTGKRAVSRASRNRTPDLFYSSSDDLPLVRKLSNLNGKTRGRLFATSLKGKGPELVDESSSDQPLIRKTSGVKDKSDQEAVNELFTPPAAKRSFPSGDRRYLGTTANGSKGTRRPSVFEGYLSPKGQSGIPDTAIRRTKSFPEPVLPVKQEHNPPSKGFLWTWGNSEYKPASGTKRRKSVPKPASSASILPVKRALPEHAKKSPAVTARTIAPRQKSPMAMRTARDRRDNIAAQRKSPIGMDPAQSSPVVPDVIVITSGSEDEVTPRRERNSKKRRIYDDESRDESRKPVHARPRKFTGSKNKSPLPAVSHPRDRLANGSASQSRRTHRNGTATMRSNDLGSFVRGVNQNRKLRDLSHEEMVQYNKYLWEAKRFENMGMQKEAYDSYVECLGIYDGDADLNNRILSIASHEGFLCTRDFCRRPAKSPIMKRSTRRRRNSGRRGQAAPSSNRLEVIDLTSS